MGPSAAFALSQGCHSRTLRSGQASSRSLQFWGTGGSGRWQQLWVCQAASDTSVTLALLSEDGEEGYPGNLLAKVTYSLPTEGELRMEYEVAPPRRVHNACQTPRHLRDTSQTPPRHLPDTCY